MKLIDTDNRLVVTRGERDGVYKMSKRGQMYGDREKLDFWR